MNCPDRMELLEVINGAGASEVVERHLHDCPSCRNAYTELMAVTEVLSTCSPGPASAPCLDDETLVGYAVHSLAAEAERRAEEHLSACPRCLDEVLSIAEASESVEVPEPLLQRIRGLGRRPSSGLHRTVSRRATVRFRRKPESIYPWLLAGAAAILLAVIFAAVTADRSPARKDPPELVREPERQRPESAEPKRETMKSELVERGPVPKGALEEANVRGKAIESKEERLAKSSVAESGEIRRLPRDSTGVDATRYARVILTDIRGDLFVKRDGGGIERTQGAVDVGREDELSTQGRWKASYSLSGEGRVWLKESTTFRIERIESGETTVALVEGEACFEVDKRTAPFMVRTPHADAIVVGTSFGLRIRKSESTLWVLEGQVRFRNPKGEALVGKNQVSTASGSSRPTHPQHANSAEEFAWTARGEISPVPPKDPYLESVAGTNPKLPGLVVVSPYSESESDSGRLARRTGDLLECGLVLGHFHRDKGDRKLWINIDRGTEAKVGEGGSLGPAESTKRSREVYAEYLRDVRQASGAPKQVPMIVTFRDHSETVPGTADELAVCEVAWNGFDAKTIRQLQSLYENLLQEYKPAYTVVLKFDGLDAQYEFGGRRIAFKFTESDAKNQGYMAHARKAITFFFNPSFGERAEDFDAYSKILSRMIEFLYGRG